MYTKKEICLDECSYIQRWTKKPFFRYRNRKLTEGNTCVTPLAMFSPTLHSPASETALHNSSTCLSATNGPR